MDKQPTKAMARTARAPKEVQPAVQRITRFDKYLVEQRKMHNMAQAEIKRIDLEMSEQQAEMEALLRERDDWLNIERSAAMVVNSRHVEGQANDKEG
jgi:uncharacterized protein YydD (DUF2326 family)